MGAVSGLLGFGGGAAGTGFGGPQESRIDQPISLDQAQKSYEANQQALMQQQAFLDALKQQNGIGNQSQVFNQLQGVANGTGPNPAQAMLSNATGANVANQAALMAGQRGAGQNVGMIARQAAQQGANTQQQAAGQAAAMQAQQSLGALGQMGNLANTQVGQQQAATGALTQAQQNEQQMQLNSIAGTNATRAGLQSNINSTNAGLASNMMTGQQNMIGNITGGAGSAMMLADGGEVPQETPTTPIAEVAPSSTGITGPKSKVGQFHFNGNWGQAPGQQTPGNQPQGIGIAGNAIGKALGSGMKKLFGPSDTTSTPAIAVNAQYDQPAGPMTQAQSDYEIFKQNQARDAAAVPNYQEPGPNPFTQQDANVGLMSPGAQEIMTKATEGLARGGEVKAMVSPGEVYLDRKDVSKVASGADPINTGEKIPGKAKTRGDNYANDTVPKTLESGGIVLPKSVMEHKHPHWAAHKFVSDILKQKGQLHSKRRKK